jgi:branched-chain amino acid aminotransferase
MQHSLVNLNGTILPWEKAQVSVFDRSYLYGDSLYEVVRSYDGVFFGMDEHLERLERSAGLCQMRLDQSVADLRAEMLRTFQAFRAQPGQAQAEAYCRIVVSRGTGRIGFGLGSLMTPSQYAIIVQPLAMFNAQLTPRHFEQGLKLRISPRLRNDRRALDPAMKSGNYLNSLLAYLSAADEGFDDALLCNSEGHLTEGTTFNIFYVRRGIVATPPVDVGILEGVTRRKVIDLARSGGIPVRETRFPPARLYEADEVFASSSIKEVWPVTRLDDRVVADGRPGPVTRRLAQLFHDEVARFVAGAKAEAPARGRAAAAAPTA